MYERDEDGIKLIEVKKYNKNYHDRQFKRWEEEKIEFLKNNLQNV